MVEVERGLFDQAMEGLQRLEQVGWQQGTWVNDVSQVGEAVQTTATLELGCQSDPPVSPPAARPIDCPCPLPLPPGPLVVTQVGSCCLLHFLHQMLVFPWHRAAVRRAATRQALDTRPSLVKKLNEKIIKVRGVNRQNNQGVQVASK